MNPNTFLYTSMGIAIIFMIAANRIRHNPIPMINLIWILTPVLAAAVGFAATLNGFVEISTCMTGFFAIVTPFSAWGRKPYVISSGLFYLSAIISICLTYWTP